MFVTIFRSSFHFQISIINVAKLAINFVAAGVAGQVLLTVAQLLLTPIMGTVIFFLILKKQKYKTNQGSFFFSPFWLCSFFFYFSSLFP